MKRFLLHTPIFLAASLILIQGCGSSQSEYDISVLDDEHFGEGTGSAMATVEVMADMPIKHDLAGRGDALAPKAPVPPSKISADDSIIIETEESLASRTASVSASAPTSRDDIAYEAKIQTALQNAGYYDGVIDGVVGDAAREAIKNFQRAHGLRADGIVGGQTWSKLKKYYYEPE